MDVIAHTYAAGGQVELGGIADGIWTQGFKFSEDRALQLGKPINAPAPNVFDRVTRTTNFSFAAGRSFGPGSTAIAAALQFLGSHPATVPAVADLQFKTQGGEIWLRYCGIQRVELVQKDGALVIFGYTIVGGIWAKNRT